MCHRDGYLGWLLALWDGAFCLWGRDEREMEKRFKSKVFLKQCHKNPCSDLEAGLQGCLPRIHFEFLVLCTGFGWNRVHLTGLDMSFYAICCSFLECCGRWVKHLEFTWWIWHPCKTVAPFHEGCGLLLPSRVAVSLSDAVLLQGVSCLV